MRFSIVKPLVVFLFICLGCIKQGYTQQRMALPADTLAARDARMLMQQLSLSTTQQQRVEQAYKYRWQQLQQLSSTDMADSVARKAALAQIHAAYEQTMKAILTPKQLEQYKRRQQQYRTALQNRAHTKGTHIKE